MNEDISLHNQFLTHSVHWDIKAPQKHAPPISCQAPLNQQIVQAPPPLLANPA